MVGTCAWFRDGDRRLCQRADREDRCGRVSHRRSVPVAFPDRGDRNLKRAIATLSLPRRLVNNLFQLKLKGAGQELARFGLNTTLGVAGLFDVAKVFGLEASEADTGQTLGRYGVGPGPYL